MMELPEPNAGMKSSRAGSKPRVFWTWGLGIGIPLGLIVLRASPLGSDLFIVVFGIPVALMIWALNSVWAAMLVVQCARSRQWHQALPMLIFPALLLASVLVPRAFLYVLNDMGDELHFIAMRSMYLEEISAIPLTGQPRLVEFDLGGMIWAHSAIVYDESDELALPTDRRSRAWKDRESTLDCEPDVHPLLFLRITGLAKHFYLASFPC